jgi:hypothetical protein
MNSSATSRASLATRDSWAEKFENAILKRIAVEDELKDLEKDLAVPDSMKRVEAARMRLKHYAMRSDDYLRRHQRGDRRNPVFGPPNPQE